MLAKLSESTGKEWPQNLALANVMINQRFCRTIATSPFRLLFSLDGRVPGDQFVRKEIKSQQDVLRQRQLLVQNERSMARQHLLEYMRQSAEKHNEVADEFTHAVGDIIFLRDCGRRPGESKVEAERRRGPFIITKCANPDVCIQLFAPADQGPKQQFMVNCDRVEKAPMPPYRLPSGDLLMPDASIKADLDARRILNSPCRKTQFRRSKLRAPLDRVQNENPDPGQAACRGKATRSTLARGQRGTQVVSAARAGPPEHQVDTTDAQRQELPKAM